jgi:L-2-hydroxyglutarate oxidase LhgO
MDEVDAVVIGAGVVGLAVGRALALRGLETVVLEASNAIGTATSSRNSEVIHAGIYYASGSLKARLCVEGRDRLYAYCRSHGIEHRRCGKLLVAHGDAQRAKLAQIADQARANGVADLQPLDAAQARSLEPALVADAALLSPSTGIIDSHGLMLALQGDLEAAGGAVAFVSPVESVRLGTSEHIVCVGGDAATELSARCLVNATGLWATAVARRMQGLADVPQARFAKGNYYSLAGRAPFTRLIYPVPEEAGLGVHLTLDLAGQARFGPDVEWLAIDSPEQIDYRVDPARADAFYAEVRRYWPALRDGTLQPAYSGVRPKVEGSTDFVLQGPADHGVAGLVNLFGIESPGLTACLAIADEASKRLLT